MAGNIDVHEYYSRLFAKNTVRQLGINNDNDRLISHMETLLIIAFHIQCCDQTTEQLYDSDLDH
jgi:hypothetical protein